MSAIKNTAKTFKSVIVDFGVTIGGEFWGSLNLFGKITLSPCIVVWWACVVVLAILISFLTLGSKE